MRPHLLIIKLVMYIPHIGKANEQIVWFPGNLQIIVTIVMANGKTGAGAAGEDQLGPEGCAPAKQDVAGGGDPGP